MERRLEMLSSTMLSISIDVTSDRGEFNETTNERTFAENRLLVFIRQICHEVPTPTEQLLFL